jgi:hypothetical protein
MPITNSTQNVLMYGFNGTNPDRVEINGSGHLKCNVENSLTISSMPPITTDISGQTVLVGNFPATQDVSGAVSVSNFPSTQTVDGSVSVSNLPATQTVDGSVSVSNFPATQTVSGSVSVSNLPATQDVSGSVSVSNFPSSQTVDGSVAVLNFPATQDVSGSVVVSNNTDPATATLQTAGNASLSAIEASHYAEGDTIGVSDTGVLVMGRNGTNAAKPIHITNNGDVEVEIADFVKGQAVAAASFPVVLASDALVSVVQADVIAQGSENNIENNATITAGSLSSLSADITNMKTANILYEDSATSSFDGVRVEVSGDSGTNYHVVSELYPQTSGSIRFAYLTIDIGGLTNMRIRNNSPTDTYTNVNCSVYGSA